MAKGSQGMRIDIDFEMDADGVRAQGTDLIEQVERAGDVVVDLGGVTRLDSSGIGLLVHLQKRKLEANRRFAVDNVTGQPRALLQKLDLLEPLGFKAARARFAGLREAEPALQS